MSSLANAICLHFSGVNSAMRMLLCIHINVSVSQKHQVLNLNLRDILTHIKMQDNLFLHFIALICTWLNAKFHAKYTLKQVQGNKFLVQNSAKIVTKVQE